MMIKALQYFALSSILIFAACGEKSTTSPAGTQDWSGYEVSDISGLAEQRVRMVDDIGLLLEEGFILKGQKSGTWITYHNERGSSLGGERKIKTIENYFNGQVEGITLEFDKRGQIIKKEFYSNGQFDGPNVTYKFGRPLEYVPYTAGKIDGKVVKYYTSGKVREEINYKNGLQHGTYNHYNESQKLDMQYEYENGKKVSGGMVEVETDE